MVSQKNKHNSDGRICHHRDTWTACRTVVLTAITIKTSPTAQSLHVSLSQSIQLTCGQSIYQNNHQFFNYYNYIICMPFLICNSLQILILSGLLKNVYTLRM